MVFRTLALVLSLGMGVAHGADVAGVKIDDKTVLEYNEPPGAQPGKDFLRKIDQGTFALQAHDPKSVIRYRNIRVKRL